MYTRNHAGSASSSIVIISTEAESDPDINDMNFVHNTSQMGWISRKIS